MTENEKIDKGIKEIKDMKMTALEKENILGNILNSGVPEQKPIRSPYLFVSVFAQKHFASFAVILLVIIIFGGAGFSYFESQSQNSRVARLNTGTQSPVPGNIFNNLSLPTSQTPENNIPNNSWDKRTSVSENKIASKQKAETNGHKTTSASPQNQSISAAAPSLMTAPTEENKTIHITKGLKKAFKLYKNGQISECQTAGQIYYSASSNVYDGGGQTFDVNGKVVGKYQGFTGTYTGVKLENCKTIYVIPDNIWGLDALNTYNLK